MGEPQGHYPGQTPIDSYGEGGFRFAGMSHRGSILSLPSGIYAWAPTVPAEIGTSSLERILDEAEAIDILLVGMGADLRPLGARVRDALRARHIQADPMSTGAALRTYNVLLAERRRVAGAFLAVP